MSNEIFFLYRITLAVYTYLEKGRKNTQQTNQQTTVPAGRGTASVIIHLHYSFMDYYLMLSATPIIKTVTLEL